MYRALLRINVSKYLKNNSDKCVLAVQSKRFLQDSSRSHFEVEGGYILHARDVILSFLQLELDSHSVRRVHKERANTYKNNPST
jgi:hypothetical protein